jgi:methylglutaconyl-CoA hydratase
MTELILKKYRDGILTITLNRPQVHNALSSEVINELNELCSRIVDDQTIRALVVSGSGEKTFSAGADLKERQGMNEEETLAFVQKIQSTFQQVAKLPIPTIAAINGDAFGGGLELALACDIRVVAAHGRLGLTECSLGIIPGAGGTQRLPRIIGLAAAMDLIFSARRLDAHEAWSLGLVNYLTKNTRETMLHAEKLAVTIANNAPLAIRAAKAALLSSQSNSLDDGLVAELACYQDILHSEDRKEGLRAFREKRLPQFQGR